MVNEICYYVNGYIVVKRPEHNRWVLSITEKQQPIKGHWYSGVDRFAWSNGGVYNPNKNGYDKWLDRKLNSKIIYDYSCIQTLTDLDLAKEYLYEYFDENEIIAVRSNLLTYYKETEIQLEGDWTFLGYDPVWYSSGSMLYAAYGNEYLFDIVEQKLNKFGLFSCQMEAGKYQTEFSHLAIDPKFSYIGNVLDFVPNMPDIIEIWRLNITKENLERKLFY